MTSQDEIMEEAIAAILEKKHNKHVQMIAVALNELDKARREVAKLEKHVEELAAMNVQDVELDDRQWYSTTYTVSSR